MSAAGVEVTPGYDEDDQTDDVLFEAAKTIGLPVMVKAAAGGGGKGMSIVHDEDELVSAFEQARRLALGAFGSDRLIIEKYIENPRHLEVQILGDTKGNIVHVFERECSVQRRFQKVVEEAPAPNLSSETQAKLHAAAVAAGKQVGYLSAGTVEFIADQQENFYFLEMNTRLQVEHPVTECISGLDLVEWQLRVAAGETLPSQDSIESNGHAIEVRLYAEDPAEDYLPSVGEVSAYRESSGDGVRFDSGVEEGSEISIYYDPMLSKLITSGGDRGQARRRLIRALDAFVIDGLKTNRAFLRDVVAHDTFASGKLDTGFLAREFSDWKPAEQPAFTREHLASLVTFVSYQRRLENVALDVSPGWRLFGASLVKDEWFGPGEDPWPVGYRWIDKARVELTIHDEELLINVLECSEDTIRIEFSNAGGSRWQRTLQLVGGTSGWHVISSAGQSKWLEADRFPEADVSEADLGCVAPMPGRIVRLLVAEGESVESGTPLVVLEAMKMEQTLVAGGDGMVETVYVNEGDLVAAEDTLVQIAYEET